MSTDESHRRSWLRHASRVARRVNLGWWLQSLNAPLVVGALAGACALLLIRRESPDTEWWVFAGVIAGGLALVAGIAWLVARRRFEAREAALVRIEASMHLRNALSAASAGVRPWPSPPQRVDAGLGWNWQRVVIPPVAAIAFLLGSLFIPVSALPSGDKPTAQPLAWEQIDSDIERLDEEELIDEDYLDQMRKRLEELRDQEQEDWFSHSSLEATDSLKKEHRNELENMERGLGRAERALGELQRKAAGMPQDKKDQLLNQFDQALQGLQNGALKPNEALLDQLRQLDPDQLGQLDPDQLDQLRENLRRAGQACKDCQGGGEGGGAGEDWLDELLDGQDGGEKEGEGGGRGGVDRGPGHAPGVLGKEKDQLDIGDLEGLEAKDLSDSLPGDLLQLQDAEHDTDTSPSQLRAGGGVGSTGAGGERVWKESLDPAEQNALKRFFE